MTQWKKLNAKNQYNSELTLKHDLLIAIFAESLWNIENN